MSQPEIANLTFNEMLSGTQANRPYKRDSWGADKGYIFTPLGSTTLYSYTLDNNKNVNVANPNFTVDDYRANDWREATTADFPS